MTSTDVGAEVGDAQTRLDVPRGLRLRLTRNGLTVVPVTSAHKKAQRLIENQLASGLPGWEPVGECSVSPRREGYLPEPDAAVVPAAQWEPAASAYDESLLPLVIEVVSPESADRDYHTKSDHYALRGIPCYLVVNVLTGRWALFSEPRDGEYRVARDGTFGEPVTVPVGDQKLEIDTSEFPRVR